MDLECCLDDLDIIANATRNTKLGPYWDVLQAPSFTDWKVTIRLGLLDDSRLIAERTGTQIAQYLYIVRFGLTDTVLLYRGLKRRMKFRKDMNADEKIVAYVWCPVADFEWVGGRQSRAFPAKHVPPPGRVFVVLVRPYDEPDDDGISGAILKWNWVHGDLVNGPIDDGEGTRYTKQLWSKSI